MREYDEYERAAAGRPRKGLHPLAWVAIVLGAMMLLGMVAIGAGAVFMVHRAKEFVQEFDLNPARSAAEILAELDPAVELVASDDDARTVTVRNRHTQRVTTVDFEDILEGALNPSRPAEGETSVDFDGSLVVRTDEGKLSLDLEGDEEGGRLIIRTDEGELRLGAGRDAEMIPRTIPIFRELERPRPVYSAKTEDGFLGAVSWETRASPAEVMEFYSEWLDEEGFDIRSERYSEGSREQQGAVWGRAHDDERTVIVVAVEKDGLNKVILNYGEK
jgi:hypothetical protein